MKTFLAIYLGSAAGRERWMALNEAERKQREKTGMAAWQGWMTSHKSVLADGGGPLGKTKRVSAKGSADVKNDMTGYTVVRAETHDAAAKMFEKHPHFSSFPGDAVEVMEVLPIPTMQ
jgi:hypothetical protein